jgi:hypothetical protein
MRQSLKNLKKIKNIYRTRPNQGTRLVFKFFSDSYDFRIEKSLFIAVNASLRWQYDCSMAKVDWLDACIVLRVVGAVLVVFPRRWRKICTILQPMGSHGRYLKKSTKPC